MARPEELDLIFSKLKNFDFQVKSTQNHVDLLKDFDALLFTAEGLDMLKRQNNFEVVLPVFIHLIYCADLDIAKQFFKYFEVVSDIFRSKMPKIKKGEWWKQFEQDHLVKHIPKLKEKMCSSDGSWVEIWSFTANLIISDSAYSAVPLNTLLSITETAFKKGKQHPEILDQAWKCWVALIDAFGKFPKILLPTKTMNLLLKPLLACHSVSKLRISTWIHLIEVKGITSTDNSTKQLVEPFCKAMFKTTSGIAMSRHLPDECGEALVILLSYEKVVEQCIKEIVDVFGACVASRPAAGTIEKLACALIKTINNIENGVDSFNLWKTLVDQYKSCNESPILSQACQIFFTEVNFQRWVVSGIIEMKDIDELMYSSEFRSKVLLRSISSLTSIENDDSNTPKKKSKKDSPEVIWNRYCEAYLSWCSRQSPPKDNDQTSTDSLALSRDKPDYLALQALIVYPIQMNSWGPSFSKMWSLLCETCNKFRLLQHIIKPIFDILEGPNCQSTTAVEVLNILFGIDASFCKQSTKVLEALAPKVYSMEVKQIMDLLNLCDIDVLSNELSSAISKILKNVNEVVCNELDQLNTHKIRTKVGKISRKLEHFSNASEKDRQPKSQRTPFRTQSNFLQRLAKAEEKNKTKNTFLTSMFSPPEKNKNDEIVENGISELPSQDTPLENTNKFSNDITPKKSLKPLDDSENVSIVIPLMAPSVLKESLSAINGEDNGREVIVAEKENVIVPSPAASPSVSSPANKMKITNARELKIVDTTSPSAVKKIKPLAGQKLTPKKVTPSKVVSYFDDDANDYVMVPPKPKTTHLTEHQMEMMTKRRTDIPAMYQDLSQDTQISNPPSSIIQEITNGVSTQENEEIVQGTPSPVSTPEHTKLAEQTNPAKRLDFNNLVSSPNRKLDNDTIDEIQSKSEVLSTAETRSSAVVSEVDDGKVDQSTIKTNENEPVTPKKEIPIVANDEKAKRKRKSEPTKFSPKQTRSKKSIKSVTPDAKLSKSLTAETNSGPIDDDKFDEKMDVSSSVVNDNSSVVKNEVISDIPMASEDVCLDKENPVLSQNSSEIVEDRGKTKKRKIKSTPGSDVSKKAKYSDDETPTKKPCLLKKKKPFKLTSGNSNLENWLVKTDRVSSPSSNSVKIEENNSEEIEPDQTAGDVSSVDLNNSEEIVPSTQELNTSSAFDSTKSILPHQTKEVLIVVNDGNSDDPCVKENIDGERSEDLCEDEKELAVTLPSSEPASSDPSEELQETSVPDCNDESSKKNGDSVFERLEQESPNDDLDLIICSPTKRHRRASSVLRGEGDTYLAKMDEESSNRFRGQKSPSSQSRRSLHPLGGRSARMLRLAASSTAQDEENGMVTPTRRRGNIVPVTYGENWPKGPTEDWVACAPSTPYTSPFRGVLKRTPLAGEDCELTPKHCSLESIASPLLSSAKRKRVMFLDPPVTKGLIYERDSPYGAVHLADVPLGSPYPTWKGDDDPSSKTTSSSTIVEPNSTGSDVDVITANSNEFECSKFKDKHRLEDDFIEQFLQLDLFIRELLIGCFESADMEETVDGWTLGACRKVCGLSHDILCLVKNERRQSLIEILRAVNLVPTKVEVPVTAHIGSQTHSIDVPTSHNGCQTELQTLSVATNTNASTTATNSTQADYELPLPIEVLPIFSRYGSRKTLEYCSEYLKILSTLQDPAK